MAAPSEGRRSSFSNSLSLNIYRGLLVIVQTV